MKIYLLIAVRDFRKKRAPPNNCQGLLGLSSEIGDPIILFEDYLGCSAWEWDHIILALDYSGFQQERHHIILAEDYSE